MLSNMTRYTTTTVSAYNASLSCTFYHKTRLNLASSLLSSFFFFSLVPFQFFLSSFFFFFFAKFQFHVTGWRLAVSDACFFSFIHFSSLTSYYSFLQAGLIFEKIALARRLIEDGDFASQSKAEKKRRRKKHVKYDLTLISRNENLSTVQHSVI